MVPTNTGIFFARFVKTARRKQNLASALGIHKENWGGGGVTMHFSDITKLQFGKKAPYIALYFARDSYSTLISRPEFGKI